MTEAGTPSIHEWLGGTQAIERWLDAFYDAVALPADPEARSALMAYAEWGSRLAVENSDPDARPIERAPVPRWGWGVAPPYLP